MVTLEAVNAMNKQVSDLADKLEQLTHRAVTITVENNHDFWALRGLQYYNENGECVGKRIFFFFLVMRREGNTKLNATLL